MKIFALFLAFVILFPITVSASHFGDVPSSHPHFDAVQWARTEGYMLGDASGNFNPDRVMDSFDAAISLAMAAGFEQSPDNMTAVQQTFIAEAFNRHRNLLTNMANSHTNWRRSLDREIAFLLALEIFTPADLARFMGNGEIAPLTKEAATAFVMRLAGFDNFSEPSFRFYDDADFISIYRRYAYLAYSLGVVDSYDGEFRPRSAVTRADFAQMLYNLNYGEPEQTVETSFASTMQGTITLVQANSIQITTASGSTTRPFVENPNIVIDNESGEISDLAEGMAVAVGLNISGQILSLLARSDATPAPSPTPTPSPTSSPTSPSPMPNVISGRLIELLIAQEGNMLSLLLPNGSIVDELVSAELHDVYALRLGMILRLYSDGYEVYNLVIVSGAENSVNNNANNNTENNAAETPSNNGFTAYVRSLRHGHTVVVESEGVRYTIRVDGNTMVANTDRIFNFGSLMEDMRLYITMSGNTASSITILS